MWSMVRERGGGGGWWWFAFLIWIKSRGSGRVKINRSTPLFSPFYLGQNIDHLDSVFLGTAEFGLGTKSDIADGSLRRDEFRTLNDFVVDDFYVAPAFLDAVVMHLAKNLIMDEGGFDDKTRVPLILGVWGGKGQGKTFQTMLALKKLGAMAVVMSAGEMEDEWACLASGFGSATVPPPT